MSLPRASTLALGLIGMGLVGGGLWVMFVPGSVEGVIWATEMALWRLSAITTLVGAAFLVAAWRM